LTAAATRFAAETLVVAAPLAALLWLSGQAQPHVALAAMAVLVLVVMAAGRLMLRAADAQDLPAPAAWVLGVFGTAIVVYTLVAWFHLLAATAFAIWAGAVALLTIATKRPVVRIDAKELAGLGLCAVLTFLWCRDIAAAPAVLTREGVLAAWGDHFIHGGLISLFGDPRAAGRHSMELADFPAHAYHFASYSIAAALAAPLDLPGLPLSTSVWLPLGFLTLCAGAYALGAALAGAAGGVAAVAALALVPDASMYALRNAVFGFHWIVLSSPGGGYGIGLSLLGFALLARWTQKRDPRALAASAALVAGAALFRVHAFLVGFPAWLASAGLATRFVQRHKLAFFAAAVLAFAAFVRAYYAATDSVPVLPYFLEVAHEPNHATAYPGWYQALLDAHGFAVAAPVGVLLVLGAGLGGLLLVYPLSLLLARASGSAPALGSAPVALLATYVILMLTAPIAPFGYPHEFAHSSFALPYAALAVWSAAALVAWFAERDEHRALRLWRALLLSAVLALPLLWVGARALAAPKFAWGVHFDSLRVPQGLPQAAAFLRERSKPGEIFAVQGLRFDMTAAIDEATQLAALTGVPAYLARPTVHMTGGERQTTALARQAALREVAEQSSAADALRRLRELGIAWYVVADGTAPRWDPARRLAAYASGNVTLYSVADAR
jgi:hypothetical protein